MFQSEVEDLESKVGYLGNPLGRMPESEKKIGEKIRGTEGELDPAFF